MKKDDKRFQTRRDAELKDIIADHRWKGIRTAGHVSAIGITIENKVARDLFYDALAVTGRKSPWRGSPECSAARGWDEFWFRSMPSRRFWRA